MLLYLKKQDLNIKNINLTNEIDLSNNYIENDNVIIFDYGDYYLIQLSDKHYEYEKLKNKHIDISNEIKILYEKQQEIILKLSKNLNYYEKYINSNILLKYFYLIVDKKYNLNNLFKNNYEIVNIQESEKEKIIFIKKVGNIDKLIRFIEFYNKFEKYKFNFNKIKTSKPGFLNFIDLDIKFNVERIFTLTDFEDLNENNNKRGIHYNINFDELIIINEGKIEFEITNKDNMKIYFDLIKNDILYFPNNYWLSFTILDKITNITVLCNKKQTESKSSNDFNEFLLS